MREQAYDLGFLWRVFRRYGSTVYGYYRHKIINVLEFLARLITVSLRLDTTLHAYFCDGNAAQRGPPRGRRRG